MCISKDQQDHWLYDFRTPRPSISRRSFFRKNGAQIMFKEHDWQYKLISKSKYFDSKWYLKTYPDVAKAKIDPVEHYIKHGWHEGRNPGPRFSTNEYLANNPDVAKAHMNPLFHWERFGKNEKRLQLLENLPNNQQSKNTTVIDTVKFPADAKTHTYVSSDIKNHYKRIAVFASFSSDGTVPDYVIYYLKELKKVCDGIVFVADNPLKKSEFEKVEKLVIYARCERHNEYDFGSYKRGYVWLSEHGILDKCDELLMCNDSCYGPVYPLREVFDTMKKKDCDFWGLLSNTEIQYHLQSYFLNFKQSVFTSDVFSKFFTKIKQQPSVQHVISEYETKLTQILNDAGFHSCAFIECTDYENKYPYNIVPNLTLFPQWLLNNKVPLIKVKAIQDEYHYNFENLYEILKYIKEKHNNIYNLINTHNGGRLMPNFSIIVPTYNRKDILAYALYSVLAQTYKNFEIIIVDDGSTDNTKEYINEIFSHQIQKKKIKYFYTKNQGVCRARNYGLAHAKNDWIVYLDSDNVWQANYLETFARMISKEINTNCFYCNFTTYKQNYGGKAFDFEKLLLGNYIDLGTFVHKKSVYEELGGFDTNMTRLVDWELIIRYTKKYTPVYINKSCLLYNDFCNNNRITNNANYFNNLNYVRKKHSNYPVVTTVITTYNHEKYIEQAIQSAIKQTGHFIHEILVSDDCSTDDTRKIIKKYCDIYPYLIKDISPKKNLGISNNMKHCFQQATGKYIAILEGDDYWTSAQKLEKQMQLLESNTDCSMCFSKIQVLNEATQTFSFLELQNKLPHKIRASNIIKEPTLNLMGNLSCCMFNAGIIKDLPDIMFKTRINEISLSFYMIQFGNIAFISEPLSVYRQHPHGVWTGADKIKQLQSGLQARLQAYYICQQKHKRRLKHIIDTKYAKPLNITQDQYNP